MNKCNKRWKLPWIGKLRMRMRTLKRIWRGILAKGLVYILKAVSSLKKCLEESGLMVMEWHSITMRPHFFEAFFQNTHCLVYSIAFYYFFIYFFQASIICWKAPFFGF
jgi:hypothetical protein